MWFEASSGGGRTKMAAMVTWEPSSASTRGADLNLLGFSGTPGCLLSILLINRGHYVCLIQLQQVYSLDKVYKDL